MSKQTYKEKLRSPKWQKIRLEVMQRDDFTCQHCFKEDKPLNVHHMTYKKSTEPWDYHHANLITVCDDCHKLVHSTDDHISKITFMKLWFILWLNYDEKLGGINE